MSPHARASDSSRPDKERSQLGTPAGRDGPGLAHRRLPNVCRLMRHLQSRATSAVTQVAACAAASADMYRCSYGTRGALMLAPKDCRHAVMQGVGQGFNSPIGKQCPQLPIPSQRGQGRLGSTKGCRARSCINNYKISAATLHCTQCLSKSPFTPYVNLSALAAPWQAAKCLAHTFAHMHGPPTLDGCCCCHQGAAHRVADAPASLGYQPLSATSKAHVVAATIPLHVPLLAPVLPTPPCCRAGCWSWCWGCCSCWWSPQCRLGGC